MKKITLALSLALATLTSAHAQEMTPRQLNFVGGFGFTYGGDDLASGKQEYNDLRAGKGLLFTLGIDYRVNSSFSLQSTIGYHIDAVSTYSRGDASFSRVPVELLAYVHPHKRWRLGAGVRHTGSISTKNLNNWYQAGELKSSSVSPMLEGEFLINETVGLKLRLVSEKFRYTATMPYFGKIDEKVKADHIGFITNIYF